LHHSSRAPNGSTRRAAAIDARKSQLEKSAF
jgi:hypothetical protein